MNCIIFTKRMDFSLMLGLWLTAIVDLLFTQSSTILVKAFNTLTSGDFSMRPTRMVPIKVLRISCPITPTRFFTKSKLSIRRSVATVNDKEIIIKMIHCFSFTVIWHILPSMNWYIIKSIVSTLSIKLYKWQENTWQSITCSRLTKKVL